MQRFYTSIFTFAICLLLSSCIWSTHKVPSALNPQTQQADSTLALIVERIDTYKNVHKRIVQIAFVFNQDIALLGATPSLEQLSAIQMSHGLAEKCTWRFAKPHILTCELHENLRSFTRYKISITDTFLSALPNNTKALSTSKNIAFTTPLPAFTIEQVRHNSNQLSNDGQYKTKHYPQHYHLTFQNVEDNSEHAAFYADIVANLKLKTPSGNYLAITHSQQARQHSSVTYSLSLPSTPADAGQEGQYNIVLPKGFQPLAQQKNMAYSQLQSEHVLAIFEYYQHFIFRGFACRTSSAEQQAKSPAPALFWLNKVQDKALACAPEQLALVFSRPLATSSNTTPNWPQEWISGPLPRESKVGKGAHYSISNWYPERHNNLYYYPISFDGSSQYTLHLDSISAYDGAALHLQQAEQTNGRHDVSFSTKAATDTWQIPYALRNEPVIMHSALSKPLLAPSIIRRNVPDMKVSSAPMQNATALLAWLNGKQNTHTQFLKLDNSTSNKNRLGPQTINIHDALNNSSGVIDILIAGNNQKSADHRPYLPEYSSTAFTTSKSRNHSNGSYQEQNMTLNVASYNLAIWHSNALLVHAISWKGEPLYGVNVELVCEGAQAPYALGKTDKNGVLFVNNEHWHHIYTPYFAKQCWLWTSQNKNKASAAIALQSQQEPSLRDVHSWAYTAQPIYEPGDTVNIGIVVKVKHHPIQPHFGQSKHNTSGLHAYNEAQVGDYTLVILKPDASEIVASLPINAISEYGLASAGIDLPNNAEIGQYPLKLVPSSTALSSQGLSLQAVSQYKQIGSINVQEFTPSEFEFTLALSAKQSKPNANETLNAVTKGQSLTAEIRANRLNGGALINAKLNTELTLQRSYQPPDLWPKGYTYLSTDTYRKHFLPLQVNEQFTLNDKGRYTYNSSPVLSDVPFAKLSLLSEVIADDGEAQSSRDDMYYISRKHFIGSKINSRSNTMAFIAIDQHGKALNNVPVGIRFYRRVAQHAASNSHAKRATYKWEVISTCQLNSLEKSQENTCRIPNHKGRMRVAITSGEQSYDWIRYAYYTAPKTPESTPEYPTLSMQIRQNAMADLQASGATAFASTTPEFQTGSTLPLEVRTNVDGRATFILHSGSIKKVWHQDLVIGTNSVNVDITSDLTPAATIHISLPLSDKHIKAFLSTHLNDERQSVPHQPSRYRVLSDRLTFNVTNNSPAPHLSIEIDGSTTNDNRAIAGSEISLKLNANTDMNTQLWLVNDGILNMTNTSPEQYDPAEYFRNESQLRHALWGPNALHTKLIDHQTNAPMQPETLALDSVGAQSIRVDNATAAPANQATTFNKQDFAQSLWLGTQALDASTPQHLEIRLPQLIGRWKLIALSATEHHNAINAVDIYTTKDVEYFLDAPSALISSDKASVALTQINNTQRDVEDALLVYINDEYYQTLDVELSAKGSAGDYKRSILPLPGLTSGKYVIKVVSKNNPQFAAHAELLVLPNVVNKQKRWLMGNKDTQAVILPDHFVKNSAQLSALPAGKQQLNWAALINTLRNTYEQGHLVGWEARLSGAVTYAFNQQATNTWPKGQFDLQSLLVEHTQYRLRNHLYVPFKNAHSDALLSAFTLIANIWLSESKVAFSMPMLAQEKLEAALLNVLPETEWNGQNVFAPLSASNVIKTTLPTRKVAPTALILRQSMALYALAKSHAITLKQALELRQLIGMSTGNANRKARLLQTLALQVLLAKAEASNSSHNALLLTSQNIIKRELDSLENETYLDAQSNIFTHNAYKCFALLAYKGRKNVHADLVSQLSKEQLAKGSFGSAFANAVCSYALSNVDTTKQQAPCSVLMLEQAKTSNENTAHFTINRQDKTLNTPDGYWLFLDYQQYLNNVKPAQSGLRLSRVMSVKRGKDWVVVNNIPLSVGELVKTELKLDSPTTRKHLVLQDAIAGGLEAIPQNRVSAQFSSRSGSPGPINRHHSSRIWPPYSVMQINKGKAQWYISSLPSGEHIYTYYSRVKHVGDYLASGTSASMLHRADVYATTEPTNISVK